MLISLAFKAIICKGNHTTPALLITMILVAELTAVTAVTNAYMVKINEAAEHMGLSPRVGSMLILPKNGDFMEYSSLESVSLNPDVAVVSPELLVDRTVIVDGETFEVRVRCVLPGEFSEATGIDVKGLSGDHAVYLGYMLAESVKLFQGSVIRFSSDSVSPNIPVRGVLKTRTPLDYEVLMSLEVAWRLWPEFSGMISFARVCFKRPCENAYHSLEGIRVEGLKVVDGRGLRSALNDLAGQMRRLIDVWSVTLYCLTLLAAYVLGLRLVQGSMWESTLLRALGLSVKAVHKLILCELLLVSILGLTLGLALGVSGTYVAYRLLKTSGLLRVGLKPLLTAELILRISAYTIISSTLGGLIPIARFIRTPIARTVK